MTAHSYTTNELTCNGRNAQGPCIATYLVKPRHAVNPYMTTVAQLRKLARADGWKHVRHPQRRALDQDYCSACAKEAPGA